MKNRLRYWFRTQCWHVMGRGNLIWSWRGPDTVEGEYPDFMIKKGTLIETFGLIKCHRHRWHRGEHVA